MQWAMLSLLRALAALRSKVGRGSCKTGGLHSGSFTPGMPHDGTHLGCLMTVHAPHGDCSARCPESLPNVGALVLCPCGPGKDGLFRVVRRTCCQRRRAPHPMDHSADNWRCRGRIHLPEACFRTPGTWIDWWCSTHAAGWHPLSGYCEVTPMRPRMFCNSLCVCRPEGPQCVTTKAEAPSSLNVHHGLLLSNPCDKLVAAILRSQVSFGRFRDVQQRRQSIMFFDGLS